MRGEGAGDQLVPDANVTATVEFDTSVYRLAAIKKAAYAFSDRLHVVIETSGDKTVRVRLQSKALSTDIDSVVGEFCNEVLDQELREVVAQETEAVRNLILAQAFSATSLIDSESERASYRADPLHIRQNGG